MGDVNHVFVIRHQDFVSYTLVPSGYQNTGFCMTLTPVLVRITALLVFQDTSRVFDFGEGAQLDFTMTQDARFGGASSTFGPQNRRTKL